MFKPLVSLGTVYRMNWTLYSGNKLTITVRCNGTCLAASLNSWFYGFTKIKLLKFISVLRNCLNLISLIFFLQSTESIEAARCLPGQHSASYSHTYSHCLSSISRPSPSPSPLQLWDHATQSGDPAPDQGEEGGSRWRRISGCYSFPFLLKIQI